MTVVHTDRPLDYEVMFVPPSAAESDFAWDNFQDQVVVHYKLGKLVVALNATKQAGDSSDGIFHPRSLPPVRAPALKLFDYVERANAARPQSSEARTAALHRSEMRVSESFNGARRPPTQTLEPLPPITATGSRPCSRDQDRSGRRVVTPRQPTPVQTEKAVSLDPISGSAGVSSLKEARAVISQLRAQHLGCHRSKSIAPTSIAATASANVRVAEESETSPEGHVQTAKRELDAFNSVVVTAKQRVAGDTAAAKSELSYYEQFLPKVPASKPATPPLAATLAPLGSSSSSSLTTTTDTAKYNQPKAQRVTTKRVAGKLPSLGSNSVGVVSATKTESNQELSPRKTGSEAAQLVATKAAAPPERRRTPPTRAQLSSKTTAVAPTAPSSGRLSVRSLSAAKKLTGPQTKARATATTTTTRRQQAEDDADLLSDFDDADPEVDAAPDLPEELTGVAALESDCDGGNDGF